MQLGAIERCTATLILFLVFGCEEKKPSAPATPATGSALIAAEASPAAPVEKAVDCKASGGKPLEIGTIVGEVYGFAVDAANLYFTSWQLYAGRGDVGYLPKKGGGARALSSLELEPRSLVVDEETIYFTSGIHLMKIPKLGGVATTPAPQFSAQRIAADATHIYGVPADYGPYDRVVKFPKKGGDAAELADAKRPPSSRGPNGYTGIAVDASGIYVTDAGNGRVLRFPLAGGAAKALATGQKKAFDIVIDESNVYFNLALDGHLMKVPKSGGKASKLASGLVEEARIAGDASGIFATFAGENAGAPQKLSKVVPESGALSVVASVPAGEAVEAIDVDESCIFWVQRASVKKSVVYAIAR